MFDLFEQALLVLGAIQRELLSDDVDVFAAFELQSLAHAQL
ncbi:MAG: hypothetical protein ACHREM_22705 [Polyangiales bacterium]